MAHWVMSRDVLVFMIPTVDKDGLIHRSNIRLSDYAKHLDALVLQGGADLAPETYGEEPLKPAWAGDRVRDIYEMEVLHEFIEADKPVLGVCRGAQLINVACGGTLYQDVNSQLPGASRIAPRTRMTRTFTKSASNPNRDLRGCIRKRARAG